MAKAQLRQYVFNAPAGTIEVPGKIDLQQLLVITDTTKNIILYNFADNTFVGTTVTFTRANDANFVFALDGADGTTTITLSSAAVSLIAGNSITSSDVLQILYEQPYMNIRMPEIGTDAFERTRTSNPQSMLDADFEYGLQPTKWLTYDLMRGYPSVYEIPGTDQSVLLVTTDASVGTGGVGESLITITNSTPFPTSWVVGTPITVKGYLNTIQGFARAEGSFVINSLPNGVGGNQLTYYAKSKVGTNNGDVLSSTYTQLRQGAFYTGSSVGSTTFAASAVTAVGTTSSGAIATATTTVTGTISGTTLTTSGGSPAIGQVLTNASSGILPGTYIVSGSGTTWTLNSTQTISSSYTYTATTNTFTASGTSSGFAVGQTLSGTGVTNGSVIIVSGSSAAPGVFTGTGGNGTYAVLVASTTSGFAINGTTGLSTITVTFATNHGFVPGDTIITTAAASPSDPSNNLNHTLAYGPFFVETVPSLTTITYTARASGQISGTPTGVVYSRPDAFYQHRPFDGGVMLGTGGPSHGSMAVRMSKKYIRYQSGKSINYNTGALFAPNYDIRAVSATNATTTTYSTTSTGTIASGSTVITVASGASAINNMLISGTGIPVGAYIVSGGGTTSLTINVATTATINSGTTIGFTPSILFTTDDTDHGCQPGATINVIGVTTSGYNGVYTVAAIVDERNLLVPVTSALGSTTAAFGSPCTMQIVGWWGSTVRAGTFDEQNGMFWQWDGQQIAIGRRSSTFQIAGSVSVTPDSNLITGSNTRFTSQLIAGDRVVIKGMTHIVSTVVNDTSITVTPDYRGSVSASGVKMVKTIDRLVPQSSWNMDRCDGSNTPYNPSGFGITINKMQMIGLQWTWYGAGFIDWMIRGPEGKFITVHRLRGNNLNTEAFMRSGNQPVRYEIVNEGARTSLASAAGSGDNTLSLTDITYFPTASVAYPAYCYVDNELISYTGRTLGATSQDITNKQVQAGTLTGVSRAVGMPVYVSGATRTFSAGAAASHSANAGIILVGQTATPSVSHWGSAFLQDGGFDQDRGYIFNYQATNVNISTKKTTAFAIRLAPSVSNAIIGDLGVRDLINRAQLLLQGIEITAGGSTNVNSAIVIEAILNPSNYPTNPASVTWNGLSSTALQTGQPSFSQIATGTSVTFNGATTNTTTNLVSVGAGATVLNVASLSGFAISDDLYAPGVTTTLAGGTKISTFGAVTTTFTGSTVSSPVSAASATTATISGTTLTITGTLSNTFVVGMVLSGSGVTAGTYITGILTGAGNINGSTFSVSVNQTVAATTITGTSYAVTVSGVTGTINLGHLLTGGSVSANTYIVAQYSGTTGGAGVYLVNQTYSNTPTGTSANQVVLTNALIGSMPLSTSIQFSRNTYALPGETIFSFIAGQSGRDQLDLSPLKELTNTPIGGRGTFPNGPDVLFFNVYLTQGAPINSNLVLRWGEAQA
jgi:hypothetical protein